MTATENSAAKRIVAKARKEILPQLLNVSGRALYCPASTLVRGSGFYFLGIYPADAPNPAHLHSVITVEADLKRLEGDKIEEHAYLDEEWKGYARGKAPIQLRGQQVFSILAGGSYEEGKKLLSLTPTSNFILHRANDIGSLQRDTGFSARKLVSAYWPFHQAVIEETKCGVVLTHAVGLAREFARWKGLGEGEQRDSGWGGSLSTCYAWKLAEGPMLLAIPNLSRYVPDGARQDALAKFFGEFVPTKKASLLKSTLDQWRRASRPAFIVLRRARRSPPLVKFQLSSSGRPTHKSPPPLESCLAR